jgi:hypothetical protein
MRGDTATAAGSSLSASGKSQQLIMSTTSRPVAPLADSTARLLPPPFSPAPCRLPAMPRQGPRPRRREHDLAALFLGLRLGRAHVLRLPAGIAAVQVRVAEKPRDRAHALLAEDRAAPGVGGLAGGEQGLVAEEALAAGNGEGHDHAVALLQARDALAGVFHDAHELVAQDVAGLHVGNLPRKMLQHRVGHRLDADVSGRLVGQGFHGKASFHRKSKRAVRVAVVGTEAFGLRVRAARIVTRRPAATGMHTRASPALHCEQFAAGAYMRLPPKRDGGCSGRHRRRRPVRPLTTTFHHAPAP